MKYPIVDWEVDMAGKYRVRLTINGSTVMFKYDDMPDDAVIQSDAERYDLATQMNNEQPDNNQLGI